MPNPWFRMYSEILDDEKVQMMSFEDQRHLVMLFALRCQKDTSEMTLQQIAFRLRIDETLLKRLHETFLKHGFIDEDWSICNWNKRQFISDSSTDRVRKYREKQVLKQDETLLKQDETVFVTAPEQNRTYTEHKIPSPKPRKKRVSEGPAKSGLAKSRHAEFKAAILRYWESKNPGVEMPWGPAEGRNLEMWLRETPNTTIEQFTAYLRNRFRSEVNHTERPSRWIGNVTNFAGGPIDKFGKPLVLHFNGASVGSHCDFPLEEDELRKEFSDYQKWLGMKEEYKNKHPWEGKIFDAQGRVCDATA